MKPFFLRGAVTCVAAVLLFAPAAAGQSAPSHYLAGTVLAADVPVAAASVTLHRVTDTGSGPIGDQFSGPEGDFRFALPEADSTGFEVFFVTVEYLGVRYFGEPVHNRLAVENYTVAVYDTTSALPGAIRVARRDIVLIPETQGGWEANEIIQLHNSADRTLVSSRGLPTWELRLPEGVTDFQAGEGELAAADVQLMGDRVLLLASLTPGDRELFLRYRVPLSLEGIGLAIDTPTDTLNVFVGQPSPSIEVAGLTTTKVVEVQGERFVQYGTAALDEGEEVTLAWDAPAGAPVSPELAGGIAAIAVLLAGSWVAWRNRATAASATSGSPLTG